MQETDGGGAGEGAADAYSSVEERVVTVLSLDSRSVVQLRARAWKAAHTAQEPRHAYPRRCLSGGRNP